MADGEHTKVALPVEGRATVPRQGAPRVASAGSGPAVPGTRESAGAVPAAPREAVEHPGLASIRVGELARRTGKTVRALHLYEELGLLVPAQRTRGGFRLFDRASIERVEWISKLQDMGLSLSSIREVVEALGTSESGPWAMSRVRELCADKLQKTREQLERLQQIEAELRASIAYLDDCEECDSQEPPSQCGGCERHDCDHHVPGLVAGFQSS